jgi:hypothetical protein
MLTSQKAALTIDGDGLHYGTLKLAQVCGGMLKARPAAVSRLVRPEQAAAVSKAIAAWNRGEKTFALIKLVHLGAPELGPALPSPGWLRHCELLRMAKAGFDLSQPRDDQGMWTSEGGSAAKQPVTITSPGNTETSDTDVGTIDDGVYHTTLDADGKPVLPSATPVQAELPPEEEPGEEESEEGIFGLTPGMARFIGVQNTLRQLDPDSEFLKTKYSDEDLASGDAADDLEAKLGPISLQGQPIS